MQTPNARVRRGDEVMVIAARCLVAGDVLELEAGDAVPADARLLQTINLLVEESALTGESVPVTKDARAAVADDAPLGDRATMLFVGTSIVRGKGRAVSPWQHSSSCEACSRETGAGTSCCSRP
jgi:Ca2+-transporting ATPase